MDSFCYACYIPIENDTEFEFDYRASTNGSFQDNSYERIRKGQKWKTCRLVKNEKWRGVAKTFGIEDPKSSDFDILIHGIIISFSDIVWESHRTYKISEFLDDSGPFSKNMVVVNNLSMSRSFEIPNVESNYEVESSAMPESSQYLPFVLRQFETSFYRLVLKNQNQRKTNNFFQQTSGDDIIQTILRVLHQMKYIYQGHNCYWEFSFRGRILYLCQVKFLGVLANCICFDSDTHRNSGNLSSKLSLKKKTSSLPGNVFHDAKIDPEIGHFIQTSELNNAEHNQFSNRFRRIQISTEFQTNHLRAVLENIIDDHFVIPDEYYSLLFRQESLESVDIEIQTTENRITSTNTFLSEHISGYHHSPWLLLLALGVYVIQVTVLILVINQQYNIPKVSISNSFSLILIRILISIYVSITMAKSMNQSTLEIITQTDSSMLLQMVMIHLLPIIVFVFVIISPYRARFVLIFMDYCLVIIAVGATLLITKLQNDILSTVFNFSGLLIILDFDEIVAYLFQFSRKQSKLVTSLGKKDDDQSMSAVDKITLGITLIISFYSLLYLLS